MSFHINPGIIAYKKTQHFIDVFEGASVQHTELRLERKPGALQAAVEGPVLNEIERLL
jgi:hypothetical protein